MKSVKRNHLHPRHVATAAAISRIIVRKKILSASRILLAVLFVVFISF